MGQPVKEIKMTPQPPYRLLIYTTRVTERLEYIVHTLFDGSAELTGSKEKFASATTPRINYSSEQFPGEALQIVPHGLLHEPGIRTQDITCGRWGDHKIFFLTPGTIPFDLFAAAFYLLSRYEEYLPHSKDNYGRYGHENSLAYQHSFLTEPLIDLWMLNLGEVLKGYGWADVLPGKTFRFVPTYDVDEVWKYRYQSLWKNIAGFYRDLFLGRFQDVTERGNVYSGRRPDPYDVFDWMDTLHKEYGLRPIYFFLTLKERGEYDKNLLSSSEPLRALYRRLAERYETGLHPSWRSGDVDPLLAEEKKELEKIIQRPITVSRNHYLRFTLPETYRKLINAGITDDYSMAYGSVNGFRASCAGPFYWYDLVLEQTTMLRVHPFCFMEAASAFSQGFTADQAGEELQYYFEQVRKVKGELITLFHNHFLTEQPGWIEWRKMYADFLERNFGPAAE